MYRVNDWFVLSHFPVPGTPLGLDMNTEVDDGEWPSMSKIAIGPSSAMAPLKPWIITVAPGFALTGVLNCRVTVIVFMLPGEVELCSIFATVTFGCKISIGSEPEAHVSIRIGAILVAPTLTAGDDCTMGGFSRSNCTVYIELATVVVFSRRDNTSIPRSRDQTAVCSKIVDATPAEQVPEDLTRRAALSGVMLPTRPVKDTL